MAAELSFTMGNYEARFPRDRRYSRHHMWASSCDRALRWGLTAYAERLLRDVYFLEWSVTPPAEVQARQQLGTIESKKAESDLFAPVTGNLLRFNDQVLTNPSVINADVYGDGWLFEIEAREESLLSAEAYLEHLAQVWQVTQRTLKGQT